MSWLALLAQADPLTGGPPPQIPFLLRPEVLLVGMGLFFAFVILPQNRRMKREQQELLAALKPGAKVATSSGIVGVVTSLKEGDDEVMLRSGESKLKVLRSSITRILGDEATETK